MAWIIEIFIFLSNVLGCTAWGGHGGLIMDWDPYLVASHGPRWELQPCWSFLYFSCHGEGKGRKSSFPGNVFKIVFIVFSYILVGEIYSVASPCYRTWLGYIVSTLGGPGQASIPHLYYFASFSFWRWETRFILFLHFPLLLAKAKHIPRFYLMMD